MKLALAAVLLLVLGLLAWVRLAPSDPDRWHVAPLSAPPPGQGGWMVGPQNADAAAPVWEQEPQALLEAVDAVARDTPRTHRLAGSPAEGRMTYVTRSRLIGFPDYTTVAAIPAAGGTTLAILARLRFGGGDMGVNRARVEDWLDRLPARLDRIGAT